jgi:hypothetical protein
MCGLRLSGDRAHSIRRTLNLRRILHAHFPAFSLDVFHQHKAREKEREPPLPSQARPPPIKHTNRQNNHVVDAFGCQRRQLTTPLQPQKAHCRVANTIRHKAQKFQGKNPFSFSVIVTRIDRKYSPNPNPPFLDHATANSLGVEHSHPNKYPHAPIVWTI